MQLIQKANSTPLPLLFLNKFKQSHKDDQLQDKITEKRRICITVTSWSHSMTCSSEDSDCLFYIICHTLLTSHYARQWPTEILNHTPNAFVDLKLLTLTVC